MKWFYDLKVATKLIIGFTILAVIAGTVGAVGVINIHKVSNLSAEMYETHTASLPPLSEISRAYLRQRVVLRNLYIEKDAGKRTEYVSEFEVQKTNVFNAADSFQSSIKSDVVKENYNILMQSLDDFEDLGAETINMIELGRMDEAYNLLNGTRGAEIANTVQQQTDKLMELKTSQAKESAESNKASANKASVTMLTVIAVSIAIAVGLGILISRIIAVPVKKIVVAAEQIADGDLNVEIDYHSKCEIGALAAAFKKMSDNLNEVMTGISTASEQVAVGSKQVSDSSVAHSQGATEQASSIEELTASLEEISSQTKLNAQNANQANELAENAKSSAVMGNDQMKDMLVAMDEINLSSGNISKIIKVIDDIAAQTNILALNAAVEAARAGQQGKGFAVVAEEVRTLAARSAGAAKETTALIEGSIQKVEGGTKIAKETAAALGEIVGSIEKVANLVNEIAVASNEQATGIGQINQGIMQVSEVVQTNSATSEESAAASEELSGQASLLREMVGKFKIRKARQPYGKLEDLSPEVMKFIESMSGRMKGGMLTDSGSSSDEKLKKPDREKGIILSDLEFGKY